MKWRLGAEEDYDFDDFTKKHYSPHKLRRDSIWLIAWDGPRELRCDLISPSPLDCNSGKRKSLHTTPQVNGIPPYRGSDSHHHFSDGYLRYLI